VGHARLPPIPAGRAAAISFTPSALALTNRAARATSAVATTTTLVAARAAAATPPATIASDGALAALTNPRDQRWREQPGVLGAHL
jgi:hypothetical protein